MNLSFSLPSQYCLAVAGCAMALVIGCSGSPTDESMELTKPPKTVSTLVVQQSSPTFQHHTIASVAPWKAERIGFEQAGRVVQVIEPNEMVGVRGTQEGTGALARLDREQFQISVDAAKADWEVARRRRDVNLIAIEQRLPTAIKTAEAEQQLADSELARAQRLVQSNALSQSESDTVRTQASTARLRVASAKSELAQAIAEQLALDAQVQQAAQRVAEAERNLKNTVLYSAFPGQVVEVHVVPGTYVKEGDPIVTVQMVDPMLVEFEVTADNSRRYRRGDTLAVSVTDGADRQQVVTGMVYTVDTVADINTRTFTVSLLVRNQSETDSADDGSSRSPTSSAVAHTKNIFPLNLGPIVTGNSRLLVEQNCIHRIGEEDFVWKITNRAWNRLSNADDRELMVERLKVRVTSDVIPFLGTWGFVAIEFEDPTAVELEQDLVTGRLYFENGENADANPLQNWSGDQVLLEQTRWMLRAGDTVRVALIPESSGTGFYVPMKAVRREKGNAFIHVVDGSQTETTATRVMVNVMPEDFVSDESLMLRIEPQLDGQLEDGTQVVVGGTHYLNDGDRVRIVSPQRASEGGR